MNEKQKLLNYIESNRHIFTSLSWVERVSGLPVRSLRDALNDKQALSDKHVPALKGFLERFGYN